MDTFWHVLTIIAMIGGFLGGLLILGIVIAWVLGYIEWINRGWP